MLSVAYAESRSAECHGAAKRYLISVTLVRMTVGIITVSTKTIDMEKR
jgi:hypothetical protein